MRHKKRTPEPLPVGDVSLADMLSGIVDPRLDGAACGGMAPMFDPREPGEPKDEWEARRNEAVHICGHCPIQTTCAEIGAEIPKTTPAGIWGGVDRGEPCTP